MLSSLSSFFSVISFGTYYDYLVRISRCLSKYRANELLMKRIDKLPTMTYDDHEETCIICLQKISQGKKLPCNHVFHIHCLKIWLINKDHCPMCRTELKEEITQADESVLLKEEAFRKVQALVFPRDSVTDELSRLYELDVCAQANTHQREESSYSEKLPRISKSPLKSKKKKLYTIGAVEYGLPVPLTSRQSYNTSIARNKMQVLNASIVNRFRISLNAN
eukprot:TRINITY_DN1802_c0_g1_i7.p2 TRINITY_DN1802_c0_g1~~TRINITY_DN1802_c0_g1_i7.p2  ORF type:complete len:221 (+),score=30.34 TRINITY_DN1802_c0_g1_i7:821-1483(+)